MSVSAFPVWQELKGLGPNSWGAQREPPISRADLNEKDSVCHEHNEADYRARINPNRANVLLRLVGISWGERPGPPSINARSWRSISATLDGNKCRGRSSKGRHGQCLPYSKPISVQRNIRDFAVSFSFYFLFTNSYSQNGVAGPGSSPLILASCLLSSQTGSGW